MRRTKIVCTLGPSSSSPKTIEQMVMAGMNVVRLNFSHGSHEDHRKMMATVREVSKKTGRAIGVLQDLQGPKIRVGPMMGDGAMLRSGDSVEVAMGDEEGTSDRIYVPLPPLFKGAVEGSQLLLDDGNLELKVTKILAPDLMKCKIITGGWLKSRKGLNLPGIPLDIPSLTEKDRDDAVLGAELGVDYIALSFVRTGKDVQELKDHLREHHADIPVFAKIEKPEALDDLANIMQYADGIMVARGDLGVELPPETVPALQKRIIRECVLRGKPVITATQMLESMRDNPRPTRAEASDVANAVFDGTDAVMTSAETAAGVYPVETVKMMHAIAEEAENALIHDLQDGEAWSMAELSDLRGFTEDAAHTKGQDDSVGKLIHHDHAETICAAAVRACKEIKARRLIVFTESGFTAKTVSRFRPFTPVFAYASKMTDATDSAIIWGVEPRKRPQGDFKTVPELVNATIRELLEQGRVERGDTIGIVDADPTSMKESTNYFKLVLVQDKSHYGL